MDVTNILNALQWCLVGIQLNLIFVNSSVPMDYKDVSVGSTAALEVIIAIELCCGDYSYHLQLTHTLPLTYHQVLYCCSTPN